MPNSYIDLSGGDSPYAIQLSQIQRQQRLADLLRQQADEPIPVQQGGGAPAPISWGSILGKVLQNVGASMKENRAQEQLKALGQQDQDSANALVKALQGTPTNQVGAPAIAPQPTNISMAAPQLPGGGAPGGPAQAQGTIPGVEGTAPQTVMQAPTDNEKLALLLGASGGPRTAMIQNAMLPQIFQRENLDYQHQLGRSDKEWENSLPMSTAQQQQIAAQTEAANARAQYENQLPLTAAQRATLAQQGASLAETARHNKIEEGIAANPFGTGIGAVGAGKTGDDFLASLPPGLAAQIKAVGTYREPAPAGRASPTGIKFMTLVNQAYPSYDATQYGAKNKARLDFTTGKTGNTVRSLNVAVQHLDQLGQMAQALGNGDVQAFNALGQSVAAQTGKPAPTNFDAAKQIVADEVVKAVVGGASALGDREEAARVINRANSPQQLAGVINTYKGLMSGQLGGLKQQYQKTTGLNDFEDYLAPQTRAELETHGKQGAPKASGGWGAATVVK